MPEVTLLENNFVDNVEIACCSSSRPDHAVLQTTAGYQTVIDNVRHAISLVLCSFGVSLV